MRKPKKKPWGFMDFGLSRFHDFCQHTDSTTRI